MVCDRSGGGGGWSISKETNVFLKINGYRLTVNA